MSPRALVAALSLCAAACARADLPEITEEQYYEMPPLFHLDEYERCLATRGVYCLGSFELVPHRPHRLYRTMQEYSSNWVDNFNHTRVHRGVCVSRRCSHYAPRARPPPQDEQAVYAEWFETCVNETTMSAYALPSRLYKLEYCRAADELPDLSTNQRAFAWFVAAMLGLSALSTLLDVTLSDHAKKGARWSLAWSLRGSWRALTSPPPAAADTDLRCFDGARVVCMMCIIVEHVCWITVHAYLADTRRFEQTRRALDGILLANSTLVVQIFFLMSSFLLAHKLLQQRRLGSLPPCSTFVDTMVNRVVRISPSYFVVVWFATSWWARGGGGPLWTPLVGAEAAVCRAKWWTHLLYLNNVLYADQKCLIQTWYLAADMQLYAGALLLTLLLCRWRRGALALLAALLLASIGALFALAYAHRLVPNYVMHRPELGGAHDVQHGALVRPAVPVAAGQRAGRAGRPAARARAPRAARRARAPRRLQGVPLGVGVGGAAGGVVGAAAGAGAARGRSGARARRRARRARAPRVRGLHIHRAARGHARGGDPVQPRAVVARLGGAGAAVVRRAAAAHAAQQGAGRRAPHAHAARPADRDSGVVRHSVSVVPVSAASSAASGVPRAAFVPRAPPRARAPRAPARHAEGALHMTGPMRGGTDLNHTGNHTWGLIYKNVLLIHSSTFSNWNFGIWKRWNCKHCRSQVLDNRTCTVL